MPVADVRTAVAEYLKGEGLAGGKVYRPELPQAIREQMPTASIVIFAGGGGHMFGADRLEVFDSLVDIDCFASTRYEAETIGDEVQQALRILGRRTFGEVLLHWARIAGGVRSAIDPNTNWPFARVTAQVMHSFP